MIGVGPVPACPLPRSATSDHVKKKGCEFVYFFRLAKREKGIEKRGKIGRGKGKKSPPGGVHYKQSQAVMTHNSLSVIEPKLEFFPRLCVSPRFPLSSLPSSLLLARRKKETERSLSVFFFFQAKSSWVATTDIHWLSWLGNILALQEAKADKRFFLKNITGFPFSISVLLSSSLDLEKSRI